MKKILFYTANGVGLGHLRRTSLIAESIKNLDPNVDILFATMSKKVFFLDKLKIPYVKLKCLTDNLLKNKRQFDKVKLFNKKKFLEIIKKYKPDLIVLDVYLFGFSFPEIILSPSFDKITKVLILRKGDKKNFYQVIKENRKIINKFEKIILPHSLSELKETFSKKVFDDIIKDKKFIITGPILKKLNLEKIKKCRNRYNISNKDFLITLTLGGGGEFIKGRCETPTNIISNFIKNYKKLKKEIPETKVIINTGPLFKYSEKLKIIKNQSDRNIKIVSYEKDLLELIYLSKLVISPASYNICNEIIQTKTPAILTPLLRGNNEQFEKALYLEKKGIIKIFKNDYSSELLNLIISCKRDLEKMKLNFKKFSDWKQGNNKATKIILETLND